MDATDLLVSYTSVWRFEKSEAPLNETLRLSKTYWDAQIPHIKVFFPQVLQWNVPLLVLDEQ